MSSTPPEYDQFDPAVKRVYDALADADEPLSRMELEHRTHHAESTTIEALKTLRVAGLAKQTDSWPIPRYGLLRNQE